MDNRIYLKLDYIDESIAEITAQNHKPFDEKYGLGKTEEELFETGILVNDIPKEQKQQGKQAKLMYNKVNKELYYDYIDIVPTLDQQVAAELKEQTAAIIFTLVSNGLM